MLRMAAILFVCASAMSCGSGSGRSSTDLKQSPSPEEDSDSNSKNKRHKKFTYRGEEYGLNEEVIVFTGFDQNGDKTYRSFHRANIRYIESYETKGIKRFRIMTDLNGSPITPAALRLKKYKPLKQFGAFHVGQIINVRFDFVDGQNCVRHVVVDLTEDGEMFLDRDDGKMFWYDTLGRLGFQDPDSLHIGC